MRLEEPVPFALAVAACALLGTALGAIVTMNVWGGSFDAAGAVVMIPAYLGAGAAASLVEHRLGHRWGWPRDGASRTVGPLVAAALAFTRIFALMHAVQVGARRGSVTAAVDAFGIALLAPWLLTFLGLGASVVVLALLLWMRHRRLAALAAAGIAPITRAPRETTDEDREIEAYLGRVGQDPRT